MKKLMTSTALVLFAGTLLAQSAAGPRVRPAGKMEMATRTTPGTAILLLDARVSDSIAIAHLAAQIQGMSQVMTLTQRRTPVKGQTGLQLAEEALKDKAIGAVVVVMDEALTSPRLTVYPEDRMAVINARRVCAGASPEKASERLGKELFRAVALIAGGVDTGIHCVIKPVLGNEDLDALLTKTFSPPVAMNLAQNASKFGFGKVECVPYRIAVLQGWAPAPTNDLQRAVYEQVMKARAGKKPISATQPK